VGFGFLLVPTGTAAQGVPSSHLTVRIYDAAGVSGLELRTAERMADDVFRNAGVTVWWRHCVASVPSTAQHGDTCGDVVQPIEVLVRLVTAPAAAEPNVLGYSLVDRLARTGTLSTVYVDTVRRLAARLRTSRGVLLGLTMAHELGHLLLGRDLHSDRGLMRAHWDDESLRGGVTGGLRFSSAETAEISTALTVRANASPTQLAVLPPASNPLLGVAR
jgi:hypothetical protein